MLPGADGTAGTAVGGRRHAVELREEPVDRAAAAGVLGEGLADDPAGEVDGERADLAAQLVDDLLTLAGQLLLAAGDDPRRLLLRLGPQLLEDLLALGAGLVTDLRGLVAGLGQLAAVLLQRRLGLGLHRLGPLDAALDRLTARAEDLLEARRDELREHEEDDARRRWCRR